MAAMLGVDLRKTEDFRIGEWATVLLLNLVEVFHLLWRECQTLFFVELLQIVNVPDRLRLVVDCEYRLVQTVVHALQHGVVVGFLAAYREVLLYTQNAVKAHVLSNLDGIRTPRSNHLTAWPHIEARQRLCILQVDGIAVEPAKFVDFRMGQRMVDFCCNHALGLSSEEKNHSLYIKIGVTLFAKIRFSLEIVSFCTVFFGKVF